MINGRRVMRSKGKVKFTKTFIDSLKNVRDKSTFYFDSEVTGLCLYLGASGVRSFYYQYGSASKRKKIVIGKYGQISLDQARVKAKELASQVLLNNYDPVEEKKSASNAFTFGEWIDKYIEVIQTRKKAKSIREDERYLSYKGSSKKNNKKGLNKKKEYDYVPSDWKKLPLIAVTTNNILKRFEFVTKDVSPTTANRWLASVRACLQEAWRRELIETNPAMRIRANSVANERGRVLSNEEFQRFVDAVNQLEDVYSRTAFYFLAETGLRLSELLNAKWQDIKLDMGEWILPNTKSNKKQSIPLAPEILDILDKLPKRGDYIIAGKNPDNPRTDLKRPWKRILEISGLEDFHIHDIRRTFCVQIIKTSGVNLASKLLRHSDIRVTVKHYSPENRESLLGALEKRAKMIPFKKTVNS